MKKKILILASNPPNTIKLDLLGEIDKLQEALQRSRHRERFADEMRVVTSKTKLRRHILDVEPQIVHFCGHGTPQGLIIEDEQGSSTLVSKEFLADLSIHAMIFLKLSCF